MSILSLLWPNALKPHPLPEASIRRSPRQVFIGMYDPFPFRFVLHRFLIPQIRLAFLPDWVLTVVLAAVFAASVHLPFVS